LGALTTFSSFTYETVNYMEDGSWMLALANIAANLLIGLGATIAGLTLARTLLGGTA
jgi:fluoride exporter